MLLGVQFKHFEAFCRLMNPLKQTPKFSKAYHDGTKVGVILDLTTQRMCDKKRDLTARTPTNTAQQKRKLLKNTYM
jgi:hypothetical protein